jgi:hypothetical protein
MAKIRFDDIEIVDPPLQELSKKPSFFKSSCLGGCGCLVVVILGLVIGWKILLGHGPVTSSSVPKNFPDSIPLYDQNAIERVTIVTGKYQYRRRELSTILPQLIMGSTTTSTSSTTDLVSRLWNDFTNPISIPDEITVEWSSPAVDPSFLNSYYKKELVQNGYNVTHEQEDHGTRQFSFSKSDIYGTLTAQPLTTGGKTGTYIFLIVNVPDNYQTFTATSSTP